MQNRNVKIRIENLGLVPGMINKELAPLYNGVHGGLCKHPPYLLFL